MTENWFREIPSLADLKLKMAAHNFQPTDLIFFLADSFVSCQVYGFGWSYFIRSQANTKLVEAERPGYRIAHGWG